MPLSFYSVRVARSFVHPVVFTSSGANMPDTMLVWFAVSQLAVIGVFLTIMQVELLQRRADKALRRIKLRLEAAGVSTGAQYVVAAYGVVLFGLLMYVVVLGLRTARLAREAELLARLVEREDEAERRAPSRRRRHERQPRRPEPAARAPARSSTRCSSTSRAGAAWSSAAARWRPRRWRSSWSTAPSCGW